jgi:hypothetical protein
VWYLLVLLYYIHNEHTSSPADKMADESEDVDLKLPLLRKSNISVTEDLLNEETKKNLYFSNRILIKAATEKVNSEYISRSSIL